MARLSLPIALAFVFLGAMPLRASGVLRWGGDAEGGAPFVEADPADPSIVRGFDVEVAGEIARGLGMEARFVQVGFSTIDASVERGDVDIGMSGMEDTAARRAQHATTIPYYLFREVLTVRSADRDRFHSLADFRGRRVDTLGGTIAYDLLISRRAELGYDVVSYDDDVHPYEDLAQGRLDAVLLDHIIAARSLRHVAGLTVLPDPVATGHYVGVLAKRNVALRDRIDAVLRARMADGTLERIYRRWKIWDSDQQPMFDRILAGRVPPPYEIAAVSAAPSSPIGLVARYLPALAQAAAVTIILSCASMFIAVLVGLGIATGRIYGHATIRLALTAWVELIRGTPLLLQLFVIYYGLSAWIRLPAFAAALAGLGLNYAAFESEIYRGALQAVPRGQLEAARTLGFRESQVFRLIRVPQALRLALPPMTNDFVALLKDSSLVSVITVVELTKQTSIFAANIGSWVVPGALCALLYLAMSLPLAHLARALEKRLEASAG